MTNIDNLRINFSYCYPNLGSVELQNQAVTVLQRLLSFARRTFDELVAIGSELELILIACQSELGEKEGRGEFEAWLKSEDFGASRYIAKGAMSIARWFNSLKPRVQEYIRTNVQRWSVHALKALTKVADNLVEEVVKRKPRTAKEVREFSGRTPVSNSEPTPTYTKEQVEVMVQQALATAQQNWEVENQERAIAEKVAIREAALEEAKQEVEAARTQTRILSQEVSTMRFQLVERDREIAELSELRTENQQLREQVEVLATGLAAAKKPEALAATFNQAAVSLLDKEVAVAAEKLSLRVDELESESAAIASTFAEVANGNNWPGWGKRGYHSSDGEVYVGLEAIKRYVSDLLNVPELQTA